MQRLELKPTHKPVQNYYAALRQLDDLGVTHETAVRSAFHSLLDHCARQHGWTLVPEWEIRRPRQHPLRVDGALLDNFRLTHGFWEAKDSRDDLPKEARKKFDLGYPRDNILFQTPRRALLFQNDTLAFDADLTQAATELREAFGVRGACSRFRTAPRHTTAPASWTHSKRAAWQFIS